MKKHLAMVAFLVVSTLTQLHAQIGIGTTHPNSSAELEIQSTNKGFLPPRLTTIQRNAIQNPAQGLVIYNINSQCLEWFTGAGWSNACGAPFYSLTSGGSSIVSSYACNTSSIGTFELGVAAAGISQTITAHVNTVGTYNISAISNGITFSGM